MLLGTFGCSFSFWCQVAAELTLEIFAGCYNCTIATIGIISYVDAFGIEDFQLQSALGGYSGDIYNGTSMEVGHVAAL